MSFEWQQVEGEEPVLHIKGLPEGQIPKRVKVPDFAGRLPESIRKFTILPGEWTEEGGQLTPSLKLKRRVVMRESREEIEGLYLG